jgi:hypothetical protein
MIISFHNVKAGFATDKIDESAIYCNWQLDMALARCSPFKERKLDPEEPGWEMRVEPSKDDPKRLTATIKSPKGELFPWESIDWKGDVAFNLYDHKLPVYLGVGVGVINGVTLDPWSKQADDIYPYMKPLIEAVYKLGG